MLKIVCLGVPLPLRFACGLLLSLAACAQSRRGEPEGQSAAPGEDAGPQPDLETPVTSLQDLCERSAEFECAQLSKCCGTPVLPRDVCHGYQLEPGRSDVADAPYCKPYGAAHGTPNLASATDCLHHLPDRYGACRLKRADDEKRKRAEEYCAASIKPTLLAAGAQCPYGDLLGQQCESPAGTYSTCSPCFDGCIGKCSNPAPRLPAGERCSEDYECAAPTLCRTGKQVRTLACAVPAADGATCSEDRDCASGACSADRYAPELGVCLREGKAIAPERCDQMAELSAHALFRAVGVMWFTDQSLFWLEARDLVRVAKDNPVAGERRQFTLPGNVPLDGVNQVVDDQRFLSLGFGDSVRELSLADGSTREIALDFKPVALALGGDTLWVASADCRNVLQLGRQDQVLTHAVRSDRPSVPDAGAAFSASITKLVADQSAALCASGSDVFRVAPGATSLERVLTIPSTVGQAARSVYSLQQSANAWFVFAQPWGDAGSVFRLAKTDGTSAEQIAPRPDFPANALANARVDHENGALYAPGEGALLAWDTKGPVQKFPLLNLRFGGGPWLDAQHLYWIASGVLMRREKPVF